ncbi:ABC transporter substrate-binding protein [Streptomyces sp. ISL-90]|nr:ABC transporter substrate-binding protein [Streptomyces sp. ISL-90]
MAYCTVLHSTLATAGAAATAALLVALAGCASTGNAAEPEASVGSAISAERCAENTAAGTVTYLTGYQYQASTALLEVLAAEELGYFDALCIDLEIQPGTGDASRNAQLVASDEVQFTAMSQLDLLRAHDAGLDMVGISSYSNVGPDVLITEPDITNLAELDGTILGHHGELAPAVLAMLDTAGVDLASIQQVVVGDDPSVLPRHQVDSLAGVISNEPNLLRATGEKVTVWRPYDFGVPSSLGALAANPGFAAEHQTIVEDFLRASFRGLGYCEEMPEECVGYAAELAGDGYDLERNVKTWNTEVGIIRKNQPKGRNLGAIDPANVEALAAMLETSSLLENELSPDDALGYFDTAYVDAIYADGRLVWPAP